MKLFQLRAEARDRRTVAHVDANLDCLAGTTSGTETRERHARAEADYETEIQRIAALESEDRS